MKKTLIALGVAAGAIAAAQADTTNLYGSIGYSIKIADGGNLKFSKLDDDVEDNKWDLNKTTAKFGIKGTEDLSNGLQAFFKFEFGVGDQSGASSTRYAYLGFKGDFGTLTLGKQDSIWKTALTYNDVFNDLGPFASQNVVAGDAFGHVGPGRVSKAISYVTPDYNGFVVGASIVLDGGNSTEGSSLSDSDGIDAWEIGAMYENLGWYAAVAYMNIDGDLPTYKLAGQNLTGPAKAAYQDAAKGDGESELIGANLGYSNDQFKVGIGYEHAASAADIANFSFQYFNGPNTFRAAVGYFDIDEDYGLEHGDSMNYALGYQYNFSERTYAWIEAEYNDYDEDDVNNDLNGYTALVGVRHDF